jgi:hypothetical protein
VSESEVRASSVAFVQNWLRAQNVRDTKLYRSLYHPKEFTGLKRVHNGPLARFDFEGWLDDRMQMFQTPFEVSADAVLVETWLDTNSTLRSGISRVSFTQRWRGAKYADHGPKALLLWRNAQTGVQQIVFEEMLASSPGWGSDPTLAPSASTPSAGSAPSMPSSPSPASTSTSAAGNGQGLPAATPRFDFSQGLGSVGLTMHNAEAIGTLAMITPQAGAFAHALLAFGSLDCLGVVQYDQCGEVSEDWNAVDKALVDHACVRRAALLPILNSALLGPSELNAMQNELLQIPALPTVDAPFIAALAKALKRLPPAAALPFAKIVAEKREQDTAWLQLYALLEHTSAFELSRATQQAAVVAHLDPARHAIALHALHIGGNRLATPQMLHVVKALLALQRADLLEALVQDEDCKLAMQARYALGKLGQPQHLPTWVNTKAADEATRTVCLLRHDPDTERRKTELGKFFHPTRPAHKLQLSTVYAAGELDREQLQGQQTRQSPEEKALVTEISALFTSAGGGFQHASKIELSKFDVGALLDSPFFDDEQSGPLYGQVAFFEHDGQVYLQHVALHEIEDRGCPC